MGDGFGATPEMSKRNLIWVVTKMRVLIEHYPSWYFLSPDRILSFFLTQNKQIF